ncbi:MAG: hypothetical protein Q7V57_16005 [Actinomycetota bacterium]|nr:hypothetical protein [Actinomycetota bacterium]
MTIAGDTPPVLVARVVPNVTGLDKQFDYLVPTAMHDRIAVGSLVRVPLHGRTVGGWVVALGPADPAVPVEKLLPITKWSSVGPSAEVIALAEWAERRWAAARLRPFLVTAGPPTMVAALPRSRRTVVAGAADDVVAGLRVTAPLTDPLPMVVEIVRRGPSLVIHPTPAAARAIANRLRKAGLTVAHMPDDWAAAAAGVDVVVGSRAAVWAPCPGLRSIVVLDEHDEALQEERTPTWHARDVAIERAARAGAACVLVSPCPSATAVRWAGSRVQQLSVSERVNGWPFLEIVDRSDEEPWKRSLLTSELIGHLRDCSKRVVCVINTTGRARLLACRSCRTLQRCERCDAAVAQGDDALLTCRRCGTTRPVVCQQCGSSAMALMKPGVSRLQEELAAAANRPVVAVIGSTDELPAGDVYVGTEAVLHRVRGVDVVAFLDFDAELLAPRYRAGEQAMALLVRAGRLVGPRSGGGRVLVQTFVPNHEVLQAARFADLAPLAESELARRRLLGLPPFRALAVIEGSGAVEMASATGLEAAPTATGMMLRADSWDELGAALLAVSRPKGSRLRVEVDPPRA